MTEAIHVLKGVQGFLGYLRARNDSPNTVRGYNRDLLQFVRFVGHSTKTTEIDRKTIRSYVAGLSDSGLKRATIHRKLAAIKSFCLWLLRENHAEINPAEGMSAGRKHLELPDVPSEENMQRLLGGKLPTPCPERDRVILELLYGCGLRASELVGADVADFQDGMLLVRGKGRKERLVPVGKCAATALRRWLVVRTKLLSDAGKESPALVFGLRGSDAWERMAVRSIGRILKQAAKAKGLPDYHPHQLRHACATHMHDHGAPIQAIAAMLGHARLSTSQIYTRVSSGRMMQAYRAAHPQGGPKATRREGKRPRPHATPSGNTDLGLKTRLAPLESYSSVAESHRCRKY